MPSREAVMQHPALNGVPPSPPDPRERLRRDLDSILQMTGVIVSAGQLHQLALWFDAEVDIRAERRWRAAFRARETGA